MNCVRPMVSCNLFIFFFKKNRTQLLQILDSLSKYISYICSMRQLLLFSVQFLFLFSLTKDRPAIYSYVRAIVSRSVVWLSLLCRNKEDSSKEKAGTLLYDLRVKSTMTHHKLLSSYNAVLLLPLSTALNSFYLRV